MILSTIDESAAFLETLRRQHKITLRRVEAIEKRLHQEQASEAPAKVTRIGLADWFRRLMGH